MCLYQVVRHDALWCKQVRKPIKGSAKCELLLGLQDHTDAILKKCSWRQFCIKNSSLPWDLCFEISTMSEIFLLVQMNYSWLCWTEACPEHSDIFYFPPEIMNMWLFLHNTSFNTFPCVCVMQHGPTNSPVRLIHTQKSERCLMLALIWRARILFFFFFSPRTQCHVKDSTHKVAQGSGKPERDDTLDEILSVCDKPDCNG